MQKHSETHRNMQKHAGTRRNMQAHAGTRRNMQKRAERCRQHRGRGVCWPTARRHAGTRADPRNQRSGGRSGARHPTGTAWLTASTSPLPVRGSRRRPLGTSLPGEAPQNESPWNAGHESPRRQRGSPPSGDGAGCSKEWPPGKESGTEPVGSSAPAAGTAGTLSLATPGLTCRPARLRASSWNIAMKESP